MSIPIDIAVENVKKFSKDVPGVNLIFSDMEKVESWVARKGKDDGFTNDLRQRLYALSEADIQILSKKTSPLLWVLFFLPSSTSFFLLSELHNIAPNITDDLLNHALSVMSDVNSKDKRHAQIFIDRCNHLNSANFVSNITSSQFSRALIGAIEETKRESGDVY